MSAVEAAYAAAAAWRALAEAAQDALARAGSAAAALTCNNSGAAVDVFDLRWRALAAAEQDGPLPRFIDACQALAVRCEEYAERLIAAPS